MLKIFGIQPFDPEIHPKSQAPPVFSKSFFTFSDPLLSRNEAPPKFVLPPRIVGKNSENRSENKSDSQKSSENKINPLDEVKQRILSLLGEENGLPSEKPPQKIHCNTASCKPPFLSAGGRGRECFPCFWKRIEEEKNRKKESSEVAKTENSGFTGKKEEGSSSGEKKKELSDEKKESVEKKENVRKKHFDSNRLCDWTIPLHISTETDVAFPLNASNPSGLYVVESLRASIAPPSLKSEILERWNKESIIRKIKSGFSGEGKDSETREEDAILEGPLPSPPSWMPVYKLNFEKFYATLPPPPANFSISNLASFLGSSQSSTEVGSEKGGLFEKNKAPLFIRYLKNFMTPAEVSWLVAFCKKNKVPGNSTVVSDKAPNGKETNHRFRKSETYWLQKAENPLVYRIESRACALVGLPLSHLEALQVVHYKGPGDFFSDHFDALTNESTFEKFEKTRNQRIVSIFVYMSDPVECSCKPEIQRDANGVPIPGTVVDPPCASTNFKHIKTAFKEKAGNAILWASSNPDGLIPEASLHSGVSLCPASGDKWGINCWIRSVPM